MKIAIAQINPILGNLSANVLKINKVYEEVKNKSDLVIFPEMVMTGYPPMDLLLESNFISQVEKNLNIIAKRIGNTTAIIGTVRKVNGDLKNCAAILKNGKIIDYRDKTLLPTYDVFDEDRYFTPSLTTSPIKLKLGNISVKVGLHICEDLWNQNGEIDVISSLVDQGAEMMINLSASPYSVNRIRDRIDIVRQKVQEVQIPFIYCNIVGAQDELIFDGYSFVINNNGSLIHLCNGFSESIEVIEINQTIEKEFPLMKKEKEIFNALSLGVKDYFLKTNHKLAVIGLSGGVDSALTAAIAVDALGSENVYGYSMPSCYSSEHSITDAKKLAMNLGINYDLLPIKNVHQAMLDSLEGVIGIENESIAFENLQSRLRGNLLMTIANKKGALVLNTGNKTEVGLGYMTMYGDMCGALGVLSDLNKHEVYAIAEWLNHNKNEVIPKNTITKVPSAELKPNQIDPFDYEKISPIVQKVITENKHLQQLLNEGYNENEVKEYLIKIRNAEFKRRQAALGLRISNKAFGIGRRYPVVNQFEG